ncbi:hypothetical protein [Bacillus sp. FJAT-29937]|uniref:hypothetical protein n=1 Tax=Bacillus sp. FJAT-29937 TaxID=1720553 RepID=UPI00083625F9|nr:hypothetical protein [Bacillus sp. FJAT-29937]
MIRKVGAGFFAFFFVLMSFLPAAVLAEGNFNPGTFSPGSFSPNSFSPGSFKPGEFNPGEFSPGQFDPGEFNPGQFSPGIFNPGQYNPGQFSPGQFNPGDFQPGAFTPGQTSPGQHSPGNNTFDPTTRPGNHTGEPKPISPFDPPTIDLPGNVKHPNDNTDNNSNDPNTTNPGENGSDNPPRFDFEDNENYKNFKFVLDSMVVPAVEGIDKFTLTDIDWDKYGMDYQKSLSLGLLKNQLERTFTGESFISDVGNIGLDVWSGVEHAKHIGGFVNSWTDIKAAWNAAQTGSSFSTAASSTGSILSNATKTFDMGTGIAGKAAPWMAVISTGISSAETVMHFANGNKLDGFASLGETLMSGAVVLSASGVGAPIAAGVAIVGGVLWGVSTVIKNKDKIARTAKKVGKFFKDGFNKVKGWFGK